MLVAIRNVLVAIVKIAKTHTKRHVAIRNVLVAIRNVLVAIRNVRVAIRNVRVAIRTYLSQ